MLAFTFRLTVLLVFFSLSACASGSFELYVFNPAKGPISILVDGEPRPLQKYGNADYIEASLKSGTQIEIKAGDKLLEQLTVGEVPLDLGRNEKAVYIVDGPMPLVVADYTAFYGEATETPKITGVRDISTQKWLRLQGDEEIAFPSKTFPRERPEGHKMLRLIHMPPQLPADKVEPFLYYELKNLK